MTAVASVDAGGWIVRTRPRAQAAVRLVCLPHAGGTSALFRDWGDALPGSIEVCAVELPGRGGRRDEPPARELGPLVERMAAALEPALDRPFALFGHSLGGLLAFELARELRRRGGPAPERIFLSASRAPQTPAAGRRLSELDDDELIAAVADLGGVPPALLAHRELIALGLPALRADIALLEGYEHRDEEPLDCPLSLVAAARDRVVELDAIEPWADHTLAGASLAIVPGDHFYLSAPERAHLLALIARELAPEATR